MLPRCTYHTGVWSSRGSDVGLFVWIGTFNGRLVERSQQLLFLNVTTSASKTPPSDTPLIKLTCYSQTLSPVSLHSRKAAMHIQRRLKGDPLGGAYEHVGCFLDSSEDHVLGYTMKNPDMTPLVGLIASSSLSFELFTLHWMFPSFAVKVFCATLQ